jgi:16S rRNA processing protein RimM
MQLDDLYEIGYILKPHGLKGAVNILLDVDDPSKYKEMESVVVKIGEQLVPFFIKSIQIEGSKGTILFEEIDSVEDAQELKSCTLMLPVENLPPLGEGKFYYHDVIGYQIKDEALGPLGSIENIITGSNQDLISMRYKDKEILIPVASDIVLRADHKKKEVIVHLPEGLLEIYL